ncbi:MAG TPA: hypothetical protein VGF45_03205 [Polyangia bacterium]
MSRIEKLKSGAAVLGAVASAVVGLYGVYEKVRSDARADTAASYNTLAPQVNQLGEALKQLQQENQQLREIVAHSQGKPRMAVVPPAATTKRRENAAAKPAKAANGQAPAAAPPAAAPATEAPSAAAPNQAAPPAEAPTAANPPTPATPPEATPAEAAPANEDDRISGLLRTVGRTREAIESLKKVPEDFGRVVEKPQ